MRMRILCPAVAAALTLAAPSVLVAATSLSTTPPAPATVRAGEITAAKRALHAAASSGATQDILRVRARFAALAVESPASPLLHYWVAVCDWRAVPRLSGRNPAEAERYCTEALSEVDLALKANPRDAESMALRANLLGLSLRFKPGAMMTLGPEIEATTRSALRSAPANPRVQLLAGINTLNKPAFVGGGPRQALPQFQESLRLFEIAPAPADGTAPDWGHDDAYLWAGRAAMELGDATAARGYYRKALEVTPDHGWVLHDLLPEAEKAIAAIPGAK